MICVASACSDVARSTESAVHIRQSGEPWTLSASVFLLSLRLCGCLAVAAHPDPRHPSNIPGGKYRRVLHADTIDVNGYRKKREGKPAASGLLPRFFLVMSA